MWLLDRLIRELEARGCSFEPGTGYDHGLFCRLGNERAQILGKEKVNQFDNPSYDPKANYLDRGPTYIYVPTGLLKIQIKNEWNIVSEWMDARNSPLDDRLHEVTGGIIEHLEGMRRRKEEREQEARLEQIARERRQEIQRARELEQERLRELERLAHSLARSVEVNLLADRIVGLARTKTLLPKAAERIENWVHWARNHASSLDVANHILESLISADD